MLISSAVAESVLRLFSLVFSVLCACLLGSNRETHVIMVEKTASVKDIRCFWVLTVVSSVVGGYHLIQFVKCMTVGKIAEERILEWKKLDGWISLALDQSTTYLVLAALAAAMQGGVIAVAGEEEFQWMKLSDLFRKFCKQTAGGLACAAVASCSMALLNVISSHHLFKLYLSPSSSSKLSKPNEQR